MDGTGAFIMYRQRSIRSSLAIRNDEPIPLPLSTYLTLSLSLSYIGWIPWHSDWNSLASHAASSSVYSRLYRFVSTELITRPFSFPY